MTNIIKVRGARQHNLKEVDIDIPKDKFVVFTGVSGSGKSSLAFDTIYAEGQRRYVESLSAYARQFLGIMEKPDVDLIEGLSPSISIDQKTVSNNPRSTVGTITEIYDYLRLLFARIGHPHCPNCGIEIRKLSVDEIVGKIEEQIIKTVATDKIKPHIITIMSPVVRARKGEFKELFDNLQSKGFNQARVDGTIVDITDDIGLLKTNKHSVEAIIDTLSVTHANLKDNPFKDQLRSRLTNDVEQSSLLSDGLVIVRANEEENLYSEKFSCPTCGHSLPEIEPRMFSFNSPLGACEKCKGLGTIFKIDPDLVLNRKLSINEGGIMPFSKFFFHETWYTRLIREVADDEGINLNTPLENISEDKIGVLLNGTGRTYRVHGTNRMGRDTAISEVFDGIIKELERRYFENTSEYAGFELQKYMREEVCDRCHGDKLKPEILAITINGINIAVMSQFSILQLLQYIDKELATITSYETQIAKPITKEIASRLNFLKNVGLAYLTISRTAKTLSGGELQRIRLASQIGTGLTGVLYVLDEPSIGLHPRDVSALIDTLHNLKELGNTLIVVEHDQETIESADYVIELGPKAGKHGGKVTFTGTVPEMLIADSSLTGQYLSGKKTIESKKRTLMDKKGKIILYGAKQFNLKNVDIEIPLGNLISVTGVSGSGKSTLIMETLYPALKYHIDGHYQDTMGEFQRIEGFHYVDRVFMVDQSPIGRTPRSNPATYIGFFDEIREIYASTIEAKARGFQKGRFSFNLKGGRCEKCQGAGVIKIEMQFLPDVYVTCDVCEGKRYNRETLEVKYKEKSIYEILKMTVDDAVSFFSNHVHIYHKLKLLQDVGLGYIELGQPAPTFSGGEPTTGLHFDDIRKLLHALNELVDRGNTVVVIEHNLDVIKNSQYIIDLGPEGGDGGGAILYQGELKGILSVQESHTGSYLQKIIKN
ncbi:excinuclease ABC subunit UvrA [Candidatus Roizmanbacteria bacterium]|nr:excinuclease ABC subunit UvrA [Candidatus Roizmanbacteria bacterium]